VVGVIALAAGLVSALFGIDSRPSKPREAPACVSSNRELGPDMSGFGLDAAVRGFGMGTLAALALTATLYHCLNHAFFKACCSVCRLGAACHARAQLDRLGGLIHACVGGLVRAGGTVAIAGLRRLTVSFPNGCCSKAFLFTPGAAACLYEYAGAGAAAAIALAAALSGYVM